MKNTSIGAGLCLSLLFFIGLSVRSASPQIDEPAGIKFFTGSWKEVLAEAKRQNKPVFVDIFTTWCGPCKRMAKEAFPDATVGEKFNTHFINYQIDAEKGEGIDVAKKYAVSAFPTSLYVSASGDLIHRATGYGSLKGLLDEANKAIDAAKDPNPLSVMENQFVGGKRNLAFLEAYLQKRAKFEMPSNEALVVYLKKIPEAEWSADKTISLMAGNATTFDAKIQNTLLKKLTEMKGVTGEQATTLRTKLSDGISRLNQAQFKQATTRKNEQMLAEVIKTNQTYENATRGVNLTPEQAAEFANGYRMRFYQETGNKAKYITLVATQANNLMKITAGDFDKLNKIAYQNFEKETRLFPDSVKQSDNFKQYAAAMKQVEPKQSASKLNNLAWAYYENSVDKKALNQALTWSARSLEYDRSGMHLDTYAHLLNKLGRKTEAVKIQEEAITKEKAAGGDPASYEKELAIMKTK